MPPNIGYSQSRISFKTSPFYTIQKTLAPVRELDPREKTRDTARVTINLDTSVANDIVNDSTLRVMVFCAAQSYDAAWKPVDIAFPQHAELKVNQEDVKTNLKGLKNKPGSTRPADITPLLRKKSHFPNVIELVYALTSQVCLSDHNVTQQVPVSLQITEISFRCQSGAHKIYRVFSVRSAQGEIYQQRPHLARK